MYGQVIAVTHRSLLRCYEGTPCSHCPAPLVLLGSYLDDDARHVRSPDPYVGVYLCCSCDQVIEVRPTRVVTYQWSTSFRPRRRRAG